MRMANAMVNSNAVSRIFQTGESEKVEFKESFGREALGTLCAFANTKGGRSLLGLKIMGRYLVYLLGNTHCETG